MKLLIFFFLISLCVNNGSNLALAFPNTAGGCATGGAVGDSHLTNPTTGPLATGSFQVFLDATTALQPDTPAAVTPSQVYTLSIVPSNGAAFRGALIRVADIGANLEPGTNAQVATMCTDAAGVSHMDNELKTDFKATIQVSGTANVILDVTVVVANNGSEGSIYYYSQFELQPLDATSTPMATPIAAPVAVPTMMTETPVAEPMMTEAPAATNVAPTSVPISMVEPTVTPLAAIEPTGTPSTEPISYAPVMDQTQSKAPVGEETMESNAPSIGSMNMTMNMTDTNNTTPMSSPVRAPIAAPTSSSFAVMRAFPARSSLLALLSVVVVAVV